MADFYELMSVFDQVGGYDILLPFLLVFTLVFAVLQKIQLFGQKKNINAIVSLVLAIFFLQNTYLIFVLQKFLPNVSIFLIIFLMLLLLIGIFSGGARPWTGISLGVAAVVSIIAILIALFSDMFSPVVGGGTGLGYWYASIDPGTKFMAWLLVLAVIFVMFIMKDGSNPGKKWHELLEDFGRGITGQVKP